MEQAQASNTDLWLQGRSRTVNKKSKRKNDDLSTPKPEAAFDWLLT